MASLAMAATCLASPSLPLHGLSLLVNIQRDFESGSLFAGVSDLTHLVQSEMRYFEIKQVTV